MTTNFCLYLVRVPTCPFCIQHIDASIKKIWVVLISQACWLNTIILPCQPTLTILALYFVNLYTLELHRKKCQSFFLCQDIYIRIYILLSTNDGNIRTQWLHNIVRFNVESQHVHVLNKLIHHKIKKQHYFLYLILARMIKIFDRMDQNWQYSHFIKQFNKAA